MIRVTFYRKNTHYIYKQVDIKESELQQLLEEYEDFDYTVTEL